MVILTPCGRRFLQPSPDTHLSSGSGRMRGRLWMVLSSPGTRRQDWCMEHRATCPRACRA